MACCRKNPTPRSASHEPRRVRKGRTLVRRNWAWVIPIALRPCASDTPLVTSLSWQLIGAPRNAATRFLVFGALLLPPVALSLFRFREPWFGYVIVAYPALGVLQLLLLSHIQRRLREMVRVSQDLVDPSVSGR